MHVYFHEFKTCYTDTYVFCHDAAFAVSLSRGDFLIRAGGLKIPSMISTQNVKLTWRCFEKGL